MPHDTVTQPGYSGATRPSAGVRAIPYGANSSALAGGVPAAGGSQPRQLYLDHLESPLGTILLVSDEAGSLRALDFSDCESRMRGLLHSHCGPLPTARGAAPAAARESLCRYFAGDLQALRTLAWATAGTPFQRAVWHALVQIPAGQTRSYGQLARQLQLPEAARAVGWANGSNPIAIVVPCHRVIGASGKLTGYAGGLARKHWLLCHEGAGCAQNANLELFGGACGRDAA